MTSPSRRDPYADLKENRWREVAEIDARLDRGEIDEEGWHREVAALVVPAYLAAETPWEQSGKSGTAEDWEYSRSHVVDALDRGGSFLDVGCANGYLMESVVRWSPLPIEPFGLEIAPELVEVARRRVPHWADRIWLGNALEWEPPRRFTFVRAGLEYAPERRRRELARASSRTANGSFSASSPSTSPNARRKRRSARGDTTWPAAASA